jgi:hypothetical protein
MPEKKLIRLTVCVPVILDRPPAKPCSNFMDTGPEFSTVRRGPKNANPKVNAWIFVLNNYTEKEVIKAMEWLESNCIYAIFGYEYSDDGTPHLQGYFRTKAPNSMRYLIVGV